MIRDDIIHVRRKDLENIVSSGSGEVLILECKLRSDKWIIANVYRNPKLLIQNFIISCKKLVEALLTETNNIVLIGDFNINLLKTCSNDFKTFMDAYNLKCLIKQPTCYKSQCPSLVDLILVTNPKYFSKSVNFECGLSDFHNIICTATKLHVTRRCKRKIKYRSFKNFNGSLYKHSLLHTPFQVAEIFDHTDDSTWFQNRFLEEIINEHAPMKLRVLPQKPIVYMNST